MKDIFEVVISYLTIKVLDKLVADNLPNLKFSRLKEYFLVVTILAFIFYLTLVFKLTKDVAAKETIFGLNVILVLYLAWPVILRKNRSSIAC